MTSRPALVPATNVPGFTWVPTLVTYLHTRERIIIVATNYQLPHCINDGNDITRTQVYVQGDPSFTRLQSFQKKKITILSSRNSLKYFMARSHWRKCRLTSTTPFLILTLKAFWPKNCFKLLNYLFFNVRCRYSLMVGTIHMNIFSKVLTI